jgi:hypothetical protein
MLTVEQIDAIAELFEGCLTRHGVTNPEGTLDDAQAAADVITKAFAAHRIAALEEAAGVAEQAHNALGLGWTPTAIAAAIRALKGPQT